MRVLAAGLIFLLFLGVFAVANSQVAASQARVTVIISFGNGEERSATVVLPPDNDTAIKATELACQNLSLTLNYSWSTYGAWVNQIGWEKNDYASSGYYWHLLVWRNDSYIWEGSMVGASQLHLKYGDVVAWIYTVDDPSWNPYNLPKSTPGHYTVWAYPRGNENNSGVSYGDVYGDDVIWKFKGNSPWGFSSTPVVGNGMIYVADSSSLYALNFNGSLVWNNSKGAAGGYGIASPVLFGSYVIIGTSDQYIRAFYALNGTLAWETYLGEDITSSPIVDIVNKVPMVFAATFSFGAPGHVYALYLQNGSVAWKLELMGSNYFGIPASYGGKLYIPIAGIEDSSYTWNPPFGVQCIAENGSYVWNYTTQDSIRSSIVASNGRIYFVTTGGNLTLLSKDGQLIWSYNIGESTSSPAVVRGKIYVGNQEGEIYAIEDGGSSPQLLWKTKVDGAIQGGVLYASGKIIVYTNTQEGSVYVFSESGASLWNFTPQPSNYILSSPVIGDSLLLVASNNGYLYALSRNNTLPQIGNVKVSNAVTNATIRVSFTSPEGYQAILYYRNTTGDKYHAVWMSYENGEYVGYIPPQKEGNLYFYITLVNSTGIERTTGISEVPVINPIPELELLAIPILFLALIIMRSRARS